MDRGAYSILEFGVHYRISRSMIYKMIGAGELKAVKVGSRTIIPTCNAEEWFQGLPSVTASGPDDRDESTAHRRRPTSGPGEDE